MDSSARSIAEYHASTLEWPGIGYHFLVHWNGRMEYVGDLLTVRYNVASRNREVVGICLPGNWMHNWPYQAQLLATQSLTAYIKGEIPGAIVVGHRDIAYDGSVCPGDTWGQWRAVVQ
jgi:N-acetylmuramoyl-L-alanine amidase